MAVDGLSPELSAVVVQNGVIDYILLARISKDTNNKLSNEAGRLLQSLLSGESEFFGEKMVKIEQTRDDGRKIMTIFTSTDGDDIPDKICQQEFDGDDEIRTIYDKNANGYPEQIDEKEYYHVGQFSLLKKEVVTYYNDNDTTPTGGFFQEMNEQGKIIKKGPTEFGL